MNVAEIIEMFSSYEASHICLVAMFGLFPTIENKVFLLQLILSIGCRSEYIKRV